MKSRSVGAELFHVDGRTGMAKLRVAFRNLRMCLKPECSLQQTHSVYYEVRTESFSHNSNIVLQVT
jgi:hypothetical protein